MSDDSNDRSVSRRKIIGTIGAGTLGLSMPGVVGAKSTSFDPDEAFEHALRVSENAKSSDSVKIFRNNLRDHSQFEVSAHDVSLPTPQPETAESGDAKISPEFVNHGDVDLRMTGTRYDNVVFATMHFDVTYFFNDGDPPYDPCALGWEAREYDYLKHYTSSYVTWNRFNARGAVFEYHDERDDCHCQKTNRHIGVKLRKEAGTPQTRRVIGSLWHTYHRTSITSVGVDATGVVSVSLAHETKKWDSPVIYRRKVISILIR